VRIAILGEGSVVHTLRWAEYFRQCGDAVRLFTLEMPPPDFAGDWRKVGRRDRFHALSYTLALPRLRRALDEFAPDLVNAHFIPNYGWLGALTGRRPLVVSAWGSDVLVNPRRSPLHRWRLRWVLGRSDLVTSDAEMMSEEIRRHMNGAVRVLTVPMGMDRAFFERGAFSGGREPVLLQYRNHEAVYDLFTLLAAMPGFLGRHPEWTLRFAGDGSQRKALEQRARELGLSDRVRFLGRLSRESLVAELGRASLYVSTSLSDSTSVSLLEAMAMGVFPVLSDLPANREWLNHPEQVRYYPAGDAAALETALEDALALGAEGRAEGARRNRAVVAERAIWEENMERVRRAFLELCGGSS